MQASHDFTAKPIDSNRSQPLSDQPLSHVPNLPPTSGPFTPTPRADQLETLSKQNNTLGTVAKSLKTASLYLGMAFKSLGKAAGAATTGVTLGASAIPAGLVGIAGAGFTYGGSRLIGHGHADALKHAKVGAVAAGFSTAAAISLLTLPIGLAAWCIKGVGSALMKPAGKKNAPEAFKKFDESFSTHILPVLGRIGTRQPSTLHKISQSVAAKFDEKIEYKETQKAKDRESRKKEKVD